MLENIKTQAFIAGMTELYEVSREYPNFRMIRFSQLDSVRNGLKQLGYKVRIRYRGPHKKMRDTLKRDAKAFTVYFKDEQ